MLKLRTKKTDVSGLVKKADYNAKISDIDGKNITIFDCNNFTSEILGTKLNQANLAEISDSITVSQRAIKNEKKV